MSTVLGWSTGGIADVCVVVCVEGSVVIAIDSVYIHLANASCGILFAN